MSIEGGEAEASADANALGVIDRVKGMPVTPGEYAGKLDG